MVRSFNPCGSGVCKLSNRVNHVFIELGSFISAGIRVLDLSECSCLTRFILTKVSVVISESPITIIFNEGYHAGLDARIHVEGANIRVIVLSSVKELNIENSHIEGISALRVTTGSRVHCEVRIKNGTGFNQLKIDLSENEGKEALAYICGVDANENEIEIIGSGQGIGETHCVTGLKVAKCKEFTRLKVSGVGVCSLQEITRSFCDLPKLVSFSLYAHKLNFTVSQYARQEVFNLTLGSTALRELILSAEYTTRGSKWLKVGYDRRVALSLPDSLREFVVPMDLTDECLNLLALTSSYKGLFMEGDKLTLDLWDVDNPDVYSILVTSGGKVNFRVPSCVDRIVDTSGYSRELKFRLFLHSRTEVDKSVHEEVVRCD